jgi:hypothetical protein
MDCRVKPGNDGVRFDSVMPGLVPGIHDFSSCGKDVDGRAKPGHDGALNALILGYDRSRDFLVMRNSGRSRRIT